MSECVVRMNKPSCCGACPIFHFEHTMYCQATRAGAQKPRIVNPYIGPLPDWCPIVCELPENHGRLVDADALRNQLIKNINLTNNFDTSFRETATIVPAERSET